MRRGTKEQRHKGEAGEGFLYDTVKDELRVWRLEFRNTSRQNSTKKKCKMFCVDYRNPEPGLPL